KRREKAEAGLFRAAQDRLNQTLLECEPRRHDVGRIDAVDEAGAPDEVADERRRRLRERRGIGPARSFQHALEVPEVAREPALASADPVLLYLVKRSAARPRVE